MIIVRKAQLPIVKSLLANGKHPLFVGGTGSGKTSLAQFVAKEMGKNYFCINLGSTQDARTTLLGSYSLKNGNTDFVYSQFVKHLQTPDTLICLDEVSRASDDAMNILFPILDYRRTLDVEETSATIEIANGVVFCGTANLGFQYTAARAIDRALQDRFQKINVPYISGPKFLSYIKKQFPELTAEQVGRLTKYANLYDIIATEASNPTSGIDRLSPRTILNIIPLIVDCIEDDDIVTEVIVPEVIALNEMGDSGLKTGENLIRAMAKKAGISFN